MGLISFVVFMIGQVGDLFTNNPDVYMAFEYAHILIFFIALMIILSSAYLSVLNYLTSVAYLNTDLYTMPELLDMYKTQNRSWWGRLTFHNFYLPNKLRSDFEFKILHNFFVSSYHVPRNFDFGMYLCESLDLQIVELVEVSNSDDEAKAVTRYAPRLERGNPACYMSSQICSCLDLTQSSRMLAPPRRWTS